MGPTCGKSRLRTYPQNRPMRHMLLRVRHAIAAPSETLSRRPRGFVSTEIPQCFLTIGHRPSGSSRDGSRLACEISVFYLRQSPEGRKRRSWGASGDLFDAPLVEHNKPTQGGAFSTSNTSSIELGDAPLAPRLFLCSAGCLSADTCRRSAMTFRCASSRPRHDHAARTQGFL